jgi:hypothetical protein
MQPDPSLRLSDVAKSQFELRSHGGKFGGGGGDGKKRKLGRRRRRRRNVCPFEFLIEAPEVDKNVLEIKGGVVQVERLFDGT